MHSMLRREKHAAQCHPSSIRSFAYKAKSRTERGSTLVLVLSILLGIVVVTAFFFLDFVRFVGGHQEQETAIEAASLAAAKDLSKIVIEDPNLGFVSLSNYPPSYKRTKAGDNYFTSVRSINTLLATVRLDLIFADLVKDPILKKCAEQDYGYVLSARTRLVDELRRCTNPGAIGTDVEGNDVSPTASAIEAYESNVVRMVGGSSRLIRNSLRLKLGMAEGLSTNTAIPKPTRFANMQSDMQSNQCYVAYKDVPYNGKHFVFAATGAAFTLVDQKMFQENMTALPYTIPSVVRCEADHEFITKDAVTGRTGRRVVHCVACAQPACSMDECPTPGSLVLSFPSSVPPEITDLWAVFANPQITKSPTDRIEVPFSGDFPETALTRTSLPIIGGKNPPFERIFRVAFYDWLKRGRERVDIQSLLDVFTRQFPVATGGQGFYFNHKTDGSVEMSDQAMTPSQELPVSHNQWRAVSGLALHSTNTKFYDLIVKDFVHKPGRIAGGLHAGEPLGAPKPPSSGTAQSKQIDDTPAMVGRFSTGAPQGEPRPTYFTGGIAAEIRFRQRVNGVNGNPS